MSQRRRPLAHRAEDAKVLCRTPTPDRAPCRIAQWKFEVVRAAILQRVPEGPQGLPFQDLPEAVARALAPADRRRLGSVTWYTTVVKLELEVRGEIRRVAGAKPQHLVRMPAPTRPAEGPESTRARAASGGSADPAEASAPPPRRRLRSRVRGACLVALWLGSAWLHLPAEAALTARPPAQPTSGPGGATYRHAAVRQSSFGTGATAYSLYEPDAPRPAQAPVILFNHGWGATNPRTYGAWLKHLVRRGHVVIYPRYQADWFEPPARILTNAIVAVRDALARLEQEPDRVRPDRTRCAILGHSAGALLTMNLAATAGAAGLPIPRALLAVEPGRTWTGSATTAVPLLDLSPIPADTLLLVAVGAADTDVRDVDARNIFHGTPQIPVTNKNYVTLRSDDHGRPTLTADHLAPAAIDDTFSDGTGLGRARAATAAVLTVDALDYYGTWKLADALCSAAFDGVDREYALGDTPEQRFMGTWSDGVPVTELAVTTTPRPLPRVIVERRAAGQVELRFATEPSATWQLERSSDLETWVATGASTPGDGSEAAVLRPAAATHEGFRVKFTY